MTDKRNDRAPGYSSTLPELEGLSGVFIYTIGLVLAVILTATSFWVTPPRRSRATTTRGAANPVASPPSSAIR